MISLPPVQRRVHKAFARFTTMSIESHQLQQQSSVVEWAVGRRSVKTLDWKSAESSVVKSTPSGFLIAVVDATQDGHDGTRAAQLAAEVFEGYTHQSLIDLFNRADRACKDTVGCSVSAAIFNTSYHTVSWFGVGTIQGFLHHRSPTADPRYQWLKQQQGFVGDNQFTIREMTYSVHMGDVLILATDGIKPEFAGALPIEGKPRVVADTLLAEFARPEDDSLMLVTRYLGGT
jgi:hypothetical protein